MTQKDINPIDYALHYCLERMANTDERFAAPFLQMHGVIACNGYIMLYIANPPKDITAKYKPQTSPNCELFLCDPRLKDNYRGDLTIDDMLLYPLPDNALLVEIGTVHISRDNYLRMMELTQMLGINGWAVYASRAHVVLECHEVSIVIMGNATDPSRVTVSHRVLHKTESSFTMNLVHGKAYCENRHEAHEAHEAELAMQRKGNLWQVQVHKVAYFYVEAANEEEAQRLAHEHYDDGDLDDGIFDDSDIELVSVDSDFSDLDCISKDVTCIYAEGEWMDVKEYEAQTHP